MKTKILSMLVVLAMSCGGPVEVAEEESVATTEQEIINPVVVNELTRGAGRVEGPSPCSGAFIAPDLVLTHIRCINSTRVTVAGAGYFVEIGRVVPFNSELATLQLQRQVPGIAVSPTVNTPGRARAGERLSCFGYDAAGNFTTGPFIVADLTGDAIALRAVGGVGVAPTDDGGFCTRDTPELVATLSATTAGSPRAVQIDRTGALLTDLLVAIDQARRQTAVSLVNDPRVPIPLTLAVNGTSVVGELRVARSPRQAFYLAPTGVANVVALVNANTGTCVTNFANSARAAGCNFTNPTHQWTMQVVSGAFGGAGYRFQSVSNPAVCITSVGPLLLACNAPVTLMGMWLNLF